MKIKSKNINNTKLFEECFKHLACNVDKVARDTLNSVIIEKDKNNSNKLLEKNSELIKLLDDYKAFNNKNDNSNKLATIYKIDKCLSYKGMNLSPFSQYLMVHDVTHKLYLDELSEEEKMYIIESYLNDRHELYKKYKYSDIAFQIMYDNYSHKRKSMIGVKKLEKTFDEFNIPHYDNIDDDIYYILSDSSDKKIFNTILKKFNIKFEFGTSHQGKKPDALIKYKDKFIIVEHKRMKESGGGQDKQLTEIIEFIKYSEKKVYYVSYLDGLYFKKLENPSKDNKLCVDRNDIVANLKNNQNNYFVNEYGFNTLMREITDNN